MTENKPILASIVAIAKNRAIGKDNGMIWHLPEDLKHFKRTTLGKPILMGRKSYESLGKPLPGRPNLVVSRSYAQLPEPNPSSIFRDMEAQGPDADKQINEGPFLYASLEEGIEAAKDMGAEMGADEIFITGGGQIYAETLPYTERLYITVLEREYDGHVFFPELNWDEWDIKAEEKHDADPEYDRPAFTFYTLERKTD